MLIFTEYKSKTESYVIGYIVPREVSMRGSILSIINQFSIDIKELVSTNVLRFCRKIWKSGEMQKSGTWLIKEQE